VKQLQKENLPEEPSAWVPIIILIGFLCIIIAIFASFLATNTGDSYYVPLSPF